MLAGCGRDRVEELPPLRRPSPERRAGLPEVGGRWLLVGWEVPAEDTARIGSEVYRLVPPGEIRVLTQRMDSVAGQYGVPGEFVYPFVGEVRRDGVFAGVVSAGEGGQQFFSGRVVRDTLWLELSSLAVSASWPPRARVALSRRPRGAPFTRLLGGTPLGPDSATIAALRADSLRRDSAARAAAQPPVGQPGLQPPPAGGVAPTPSAPRPTGQPPARRPPARDTGRIPLPEGPARIDSVRVRPPLEPQRRDTPPVPAQPRDTPRQPLPTAPRETLRIPPPP